MQGAFPLESVVWSRRPTGPARRGPRARPSRPCL